MPDRISRACDAYGIGTSAYAALMRGGSSFTAVLAMVVRPMATTIGSTRTARGGRGAYRRNLRGRHEDNGSAPPDMVSFGRGERRPNIQGKRACRRVLLYRLSISIGHERRSQPAKREEEAASTTEKQRVTSFAPQFLVDDLERSIAYYRRIGFSSGEPWGGFYAIGVLDGLEVHLKEAPKNQADRQWRRTNHHLDAAAGVDGIETFYERCVADDISIVQPLADTACRTKDFYIADPDGYIISFGGRPAAG